MKKVLFIAAFLLPMAIASGQRSIDRLFEKYSGKSGFTSIDISGNLLNLAASIDDDDRDKDLRARITGIRVLAQNDKDMHIENFYDLVMKDIDLKDYEEFMRVKESNQDMRMLVRTEGRKITEFLFVTGGEDNALVQVKGNMTISDARRLSENAKKHHRIDLNTED
jgi:hypothetical protein